MKLKIKVFLTVFMVLTLMTSASAFAATSMVKQGNPTSFDLNTIAEDTASGDKLWIKVSTIWDEKLSMYDATSLPEGTLALAVTFEIKDFDQDSSTMFWAGSIVGNDTQVDKWDDSMPTDKLTVDSDGTYMFVFDAQKVFEGTLDSINSLQMVLPCKSMDDAAKTAMKFNCIDVVAITDASELDQYKTGKIEEKADAVANVTTDATATDAAATDAGNTDADDTSIAKTGETSSLPMIYVLLALTSISIVTVSVIIEKKKIFTK